MKHLHWDRGMTLYWGPRLRNDNSKVHVLNKLFAHTQKRKKEKLLKTSQVRVIN